MTDLKPPSNPTTSSSTADVSGQPSYDKTRAHLRQLVTQRQQLEQKLQQQEADILRKETEYLEDTPHGNIIIGFEGYTKGLSAVLGQRRKTLVVDGNRVFSRSSVSFGNSSDSPADTAASTPLVAMAPTPVSATFQSGSNYAAPGNGNGAGVGGLKKNKKGAGGGGGGLGNGENSDTDTRDVKKARTNFGAVGRK